MRVRSVGAVRLLLEANADKDRIDSHRTTPMFIASANGHLEILRLLLEANAGKDAARCDNAPPLWIASQEGHLEVVRVRILH